MTTPPDVLLLLSDGHNANYAGFAGHPIVRTPHLDRLAAAGRPHRGAEDDRHLPLAGGLPAPALGSQAEAP